MNLPAGHIDLSAQLPLLAARLARHHGYAHVVGIGPLSWAEAALTNPGLDLVEVALGGPRRALRRSRWSHARLAWDGAPVAALPLPRDVLNSSVVVGSALDGRADDGGSLFDVLPRFLESAPLGIVASAEPPERLAAKLRAMGIEPTFVGRAHRTSAIEAAIAIIDRVVPAGASKAPASFRILAVMTAYNEEDVIGPSIEALVSGGIEVYLIDNWSTDRTNEIASGFLGRGVIGLERFPAAPTTTYEWGRLLARVERIVATVPADWYIHHDADERHAGPWPKRSLRDAIWTVQQSGFNGIDHTVLNFHPIDDGYVPGSDYEAYFRHFEFGTLPGDFRRVKAWRATGRQVSLAESSGHEVVFPGRRVFPYKFLLKHYPIRSQAHGERKVLRERRSRWDRAERAKGWHVQYDSVRPGHRFLRSASELIEWVDGTTQVDYLVPIVSGIGVGPRSIPPWATRGPFQAAAYRVARSLADRTLARRVARSLSLRAPLLARPARWAVRRLVGTDGMLEER